jgi:predicted Zn-dependent peptidase
MIALLACSLLAGPVVLEAPDAKAPYITVQMVVRLGALNAREQAMAQVIHDTLTNATESYNQDQLAEYSTLTGEPPRCTLSGDHFRVQIAVPKGQLELAGELTDELLLHGRFAEDVVQADLISAQTRPSSYWAELLQPYKLDFRKIRRDQVIEFYQKSFTPENTTIAVSGPFAPGEAQAAMVKFLAGWAAPKAPLVPRHDYTPPPALLGRHGFPVTTVELYGPEFLADEADVASNLMVATALGVGKGSSMHQVLREKMGVSYIQQAILAPTPGGFQTHLVMVLKPGDDETAMVDTMRNALTQDVGTWTEDTRHRAIGMALAYLQNQSIATPLYWDGASPVGPSLEDQTFMKAYWKEKVGEDWDPARLLAAMRRVDLEELKKRATDLLSAAQGGVIQGGS